MVSNSTLREIELFGMQGGGKWGEGCLATWLDMYKTNVTLLRINWSMSSKQTVTLTKMLARNTDINRCLGRGEDPTHQFPATLKKSPPPLTFYKIAGAAGRSALDSVAALHLTRLLCSQMSLQNAVESRSVGRRLVASEPEK